MKKAENTGISEKNVKVSTLCSCSVHLSTLRLHIHTLYYELRNVVSNLVKSIF